MRWVTSLVLAPVLAGCMLSAHQRAQETLRDVTARCGAPGLVDHAPDFSEPLSEDEVRARYGCIRAGMARNRAEIYAATHSPDGLEALVSYQEALFYEVAGGNLQAHQASLQYLDFMARIQEINEQRKLRATLSEAERRAQMKQAIDALNRSPSVVTCHQMGGTIQCTSSRP